MTSPVLFSIDAVNCCLYDECRTEKKHVIARRGEGPDVAIPQLNGKMLRLPTKNAGRTGGLPRAYGPRNDVVIFTLNNNSPSRDISGHVDTAGGGMGQ